MNLQQVKLEKVLGVTVNSNVALSSNNNGSVAYPAGCTVILFNTRTEQQNHIINISRKTVTSLAYSQCGRYIVTGECGHLPSVRVWDLYSNGQSGNPGLAPQPQQVAEFLGHRYGVNCVTFSPNGKYVVSVGTQHDMIVNVWDWKNNIKIASNKISTKIKAIAFSENGSYFVTVGNRNVKFWYMEHGKTRYKEAVPLMGRLAILGEQRNHYFCDVACGKGDCGDSTYAITRSGLLCEFNNRRLLDKWVELRTNCANCIAVGLNYIFVGCAEGIIRCFNPATLEFITTLPRPHYLGVDVSMGVNITHLGTVPPDAKYPDCVAVSYDETNSKLTAVYNDHSIYVWHVLNIKRVGKSYSFLYHSACIWGVEMAPTNSPLPHGSFLTCSSDDTIRVWTLDKMTENNSRGIYRKNIYSNDLLKVVYVDKELSFLKDLDVSRSSGEKVQQDSYNDGRNGVRCIRISPDGRNVASGDRSGNIRILDASNMDQLYKIEAHDAEVLCLEYCGNENEVSFMASASRDRLLHVFDAKNYMFLQTLDDHSSSITAVRFLTQNKKLQMVSCGADKSLIFRSLGDVNGKMQFSRYQNATGKATLYDMEVDANQKHVLTACQDRNVRVFSVNSGKNTKCFKGSSGDDGTLIKVALDRSGIYVATSCTDKSISIYDYYSGECMATMCGHSELAAGLRFTNDCRRLISASGDGCIFVWKIPHDMVVTMHARLSQQAMRQGKALDNQLYGENQFDYEYGDNLPQDANYRFSIGHLPQWAQKHVTGDSSQPPSITKNVIQPKGRWAQRAESVIYSDSFLSNVQHPLDKKFDSDGSKDSSLESATETRKEISSFKEISSSRNVTIRSESRRRGDTMSDTGFESAAHDADIDSDHEYKNLYYPTQTDSPSGSEFTVTNIDADELRKSQRKKKENKNTNVKIQIPPFDSNESDDDDDDASTPSGDNTDRNPMSLFSVSSESLDQLATREKFFQTTFESMSGAETELTPTNKTSISSKFLTRSHERNSDAINAVKQTKSDPETLKVRQELNKRIAETKKKLESVGHSTPLRYSQSIHDLSHIPERDKWHTNKQAIYLDESSPDSSLRRSCSLSDLSMQKATPYKRKNEPISGKKQSQNHTPRNSSRYVKNNSIPRSRSSGGLNHSDSDNDSNEKKVSRLMRPTISSHNKINNKNLQIRKKQSYSTNNLNTVGVDNISTSDEELETVVKPIVPPRNRQTTFENGHPTVVPRRHLNNKEKTKAYRNTIHFDRLPTLDLSMTNEDLNASTESADLTIVEISNNKSEEVISQLTLAANNVVELYNRLNDSEGDSANENTEKDDIVRKLELSIVRTHKVLHDCIFKKLKQNNGNIDVNQTDTVKKLNDLVTKGSCNQNSVVTMMEQYSDILLDMVQQKIHNSNM